MYRLQDKKQLPKRLRKKLSVRAYIRKGKNAREKRGEKKISVRNNSVNTKVREGGGGGAPGRAQILLQPVEETTVEMVISLQPADESTLEQISTLQPTEDPMLEQLDIF